MTWTAMPKPPPHAKSAKYNLIIIHIPRRQSRSDFETVQNNMAVRAPDIDVHILSAPRFAPPGFWQVAAQRPSLIFSPQTIVTPPPWIRGARLIPVHVNKLEEVQILERAGAPVPETVVIEPDTRLDELKWGPFTVIKPIRGQQGHGVSLMRTKDVRWTDTSLLPKDHPRHGKVLLAQRYVDTGPHLKSYRVMTVLGRPIYSILSTAVEKQADPHLSDALEMDVAANGVERVITMNYDPEIIDLAKSIHSRLPHLPSMGIDIIRENGTGKLFALEYNSKGNHWHISSDYGLEYQRKLGVDFKCQFNALDTVTDALIEFTRKRAI